MKAHLPRHLLGYKQEKMGYVAPLQTRFHLIRFDSVDKADTSKLGWVRGATYFDTHAPALPKKVKHFCLAELALTSAQAILGAARFEVEETYDPVWTRVHVPQQFLELICPKAESIRDEIASSCDNRHCSELIADLFYRSSESLWSFQLLADGNRPAPLCISGKF